jgi:O-methyltransferase
MLIGSPSTVHFYQRDRRAAAPSASPGREPSPFVAPTNHATREGIHADIHFSRGSDTVHEVSQRTFEYPPTPIPEDLLAVYPDFEPAFVPAYARAMSHTMTSPERMHALWMATRHVIETRVRGAFVECGVWRGGSSMIVGLALLRAGETGRQLWLYDTFEGMPEPSEGDVDFLGHSAAAQLGDTGDLRHGAVLARAALDEVRANLRSTGYPETQMRFVKGLVEETIPDEAPSEIALLRLDTDWESSTRHELEHLWPRLAVGGVLIVDDYGHWAGARAAVDAFFATREDRPLLNRIDYTGRIAVRLR